MAINFDKAQLLREALSILDSEKEKGALTVYNGDPNGNVTGTVGALCIDYSGSGKLWKNSNGSTTWVELGTGGGGSFTSLTDTPNSYAGEALKALRVNAAENAIEFYTPSGSGGSGGFDYVVDSQAAFNNLFTQISPGQYKIKDIYKSVYIKAGLGDVTEAYVNLNGYSPDPGGLTSTYLEQRRTSEGAYDIETAMFSFGDAGTNGMIIRTNNCKYLFCEPGTEIFFNAVDGGIRIDKAYTQIYNLKLIGNARTDGLSVSYNPASPTPTFNSYIKANPMAVITGKGWYDIQAGVTDIVLDSCSVWGVLGVGFKGNQPASPFGTASNLRYSLKDCVAFAVDASTSSSAAANEPTGFLGVQNLDYCSAFWIGANRTLSGSSSACSFLNCAVMTDCFSVYAFYNTTTSNANTAAYRSCINMTNCYAYESCQQSTTLQNWTTFASCVEMYNVTSFRNAHNNTSTSSTAIDFSNCSLINNLISFYFFDKNYGGLCNITLISSTSSITGASIAFFGHSSSVNLTGVSAGSIFNNMNISGVSGNTSATAIGFLNSTQVSNCSVSGFVICYSGITQINNCTATVNSASGSRGFSSCSLMSNCTSTAGHSSTIHFLNCTRLNTCRVQGTSATEAGGGSGFSGCTNLSSCYATLAGARGFTNCNNLSSCSTGACATGFHTCSYMSSCSASSGTVNFNSCSYLAGCLASVGATNNYLNCSYISSSQAIGGLNSGNTNVDTVTTNPSGL